MLYCHTLYPPYIHKEKTIFSYLHMEQTYFILLILLFKIQYLGIAQKDNMSCYRGFQDNNAFKPRDPSASTPILTHNQESIKFTGASSSQECCQSVNKVTPGLDVPRFPCGYAATQLSEQLELITPSPCCRASQLRKLLSMNQ